MFWVSARGARTAAQSILENVTRLELILDPDAEGCLSEAVYVPAGRPESSQRAEVPVTSATATTLPEASVTVSSRVPKELPSMRNPISSTAASERAVSLIGAGAVTVNSSRLSALALPEASTAEATAVWRPGARSAVVTQAV